MSLQKKRNFLMVVIILALVSGCSISKRSNKNFGSEVTVEYIPIEASNTPMEIQKCIKSPNSPKVIIEIDTEKTGQQMDGIGGTFNELGWDAIESLNIDQRNTLLEQLFSAKKGARLSFNRIAIGSSDFGRNAYSHADVADDWDLEHFSLKRDEKCMISYINAAKKYNSDMRFHASPWSPPAWLKNNNNMIGNDTSNYLKADPRVLPTYANYLVKFCEGYKQHGITINRLFVQNEAGNQTPYPSCRVPAEQMITFISDHLIPAMASSESKETEVWAGTFNTGYSKNSIDDHKKYLATSDFVHKVGGFGFQYASIKLIQEFRKRFPEVKLMHTESECQGGKNSPDEAMRDFQDFIMHVRNGFSVFTFWNMVLAEPCKSSWGWRQNSLIVVDKEKQEISYKPNFAVAKMVGRYIVPNSHYLSSRIVKGDENIGQLGFTGEVDRWMPMRGQAGEQLASFQRPDGSIVTLLLNQGAEITAEIKFGENSAQVVLPANKLCAVVIN
ncbi:MAG: hypothetical protein JEZ14_15640 [Marinilabiliaceae bacterium]|nr:hypothetical protein [Marinilabiliaceae bacterium]